MRQGTLNEKQYYNIIHAGGKKTVLKYDNIMRFLSIVIFRVQTHKLFV